MALLQICADPKLILELAKLLNFPEENSKSSLVQSALDCMDGHREDTATTSVQLMVRSLRNLNAEVSTDTRGDDFKLGFTC